MCVWPCSSGDYYRQNTFQGAFTKTPITLSFHPRCGKRCQQLPRPLNDSAGAQLPAQADLRQAGAWEASPTTLAIGFHTRSVHSPDAHRQGERGGAPSWTWLTQSGEAVHGWDVPTKTPHAQHSHWTNLSSVVSELRLTRVAASPCDRGCDGHSKCLYDY